MTQTTREKKEIYGTKELFTQIPKWKGRKFYLLNWTNDTTIKVEVEGNKRPSYLHYSYFKII